MPCADGGARAPDRHGARRRSRAARGRRGRRRRAAGRPRCGPSRAGRRGRRPRPVDARGRTARSRPCGRPPGPRATAGVASSVGQRAPRPASSRRSSTSSSLPIIFSTSSSWGSSAVVPLADQAAVAQHGHPVGDLVDLVEEVGDEHDRDALGLELAHHPEQLLRPRRRRGWRSARRGSAPWPRCRSPGRSRPSAARRASSVPSSAETSMSRSRRREQLRRARGASSRHWIRPKLRGSRPMKMFSATDRFGQRLTSW